MYVHALIGGILIGIAALILSGGLGRVMGVSGIIKGVLPKSESASGWRYAFLFGIIGGVALFRMIYPDFSLTLVASSPYISIIAGVCVGLGVSLANGCTSGHAVCGIGRFSTRSLIATMLFIVSGIITVSILHHFPF